MKRLLIRLSIAAAALSFTCASSAAEIGVVDLTRVITEYYKFKEATASLQDDASKAQKEINEMLELRRKLQDEFGGMRKEIEDPIIDDTVRQKKAVEAKEKQQELLALEREMQETRNRRQKQLADKQNRLFSGIREEVLAVVKEKSEAASYGVVMDKSAFGLTRVNGLVVPVLVHSAGAIDFSDELIVQLNKDAPEGSTEAAAPAADAAPAAAPAAPEGVVAPE